MIKQTLLIITLSLSMAILCYWSLMNNSNYAIKKALDNHISTCERTVK